MRLKCSLEENVCFVFSIILAYKIQDICLFIHFWQWKIWKINNKSMVFMTNLKFLMTINQIVNILNKTLLVKVCNHLQTFVFAAILENIPKYVVINFQPNPLHKIWTNCRFVLFCFIFKEFLGWRENISIHPCIIDYPPQKKKIK